MKKIKQHGLYRTGTNYLEKILTLNYNVDVLVNEPGWKHSIVSYLCDTPIVVIVKNPHSWLDSMFRYMLSHPDQKKLVKVKNISDFLRTKLVVQGGVWIGNEHNSFQIRSVNPIQLWNDFYYHFMTYIEYNKNSVYVRYEDVLADEEKECSVLAEKLDISRKSETWIPITKSQEPWTGNKHKFKRKQYYSRNSFMEMFSTEDISFIGSELDEEVVKYFGYGFK